MAFDASPQRWKPRTVELAGGASVMEGPRRGSVFFVGTATVLLRYAGFTILTDPNFLHRGDHVHLGYGLTSRRLTEPAIPLEHLPPVDFVILSHYHGDHFDQLVEARLDRRLPIVTTPHATRKLRKAGFTALHQLQTWEALELRKGAARVRLTAMPGRHGPVVLAKALPPVMGTMIEFLDPRGAPEYRIYISGDTMVFGALREIPRLFPHVDLALLHLGGTRVLGVLVTMDDKHGLRMLRLIDPDTAIPIHFDDYDVFKSPLEDFLAAVREAGLMDKLRVMRRGDSYAFEPRRGG